MNTVFFDLETMGLSKNRDSILEIAAIVVDENGSIIDGAVYNTFINPQKPIPFPISQLTGIEDKHVKNAPTEFMAIKGFVDFIKKYNVGTIAGHNIQRFDIPFIIERANQWNITLNLPTNVIDTLAMAKEKHKAGLLPNYHFTTAKGNLSFKLECLMEYYNIGDQDHRAINDVRHNIEVYRELTSKEEDYGF